MPTARCCASSTRPLTASLLVLALAVPIGGCATSGLTEQWRDTQYAAHPLTKVLVIGVKKDPTRRRMMEDAFVAALAKHGATATASYRLFADDLPDTQQVVDVVRANGYDGVLVSSKLASVTSTREVPGYSTRESRSRYDPWAQRYHSYFVEVHHDGYTETERLVRHRVDVWVAGNGGRLVWTAIGSSVDPGSGAEVDHDITSHVVPSLVKAGLVAK